MYIERFQTHLINAKLEEKSRQTNTESCVKIYNGSQFRINYVGLVYNFQLPSHRAGKMGVDVGV